MEQELAGTPLLKTIARSSAETVPLVSANPIGLRHLMPHTISTRLPRDTRIYLEIGGVLLIQEVSDQVAKWSGLEFGPKV